MYTNFELMYTNMSSLLTEIFYLALNVRPRCVSKQSLRCSVWVMMYPHKLNPTVFASAKVVSDIVTVKMVNIV